MTTKNSSVVPIGKTPAAVIILKKDKPTRIKTTNKA